MKRIMILFAAVFSLIWGGCSDPFENQAFRETDKMPAASYMEANSSTYSPVPKEMIIPLTKQQSIIIYFSSLLDFNL